jgi:hypothetical protein
MKIFAKLLGNIKEGTATVVLEGDIPEADYKSMYEKAEADAIQEMKQHLVKDALLNLAYGEEVVEQTRKAIAAVRQHTAENDIDHHVQLPKLFSLLKEKYPKAAYVGGYEGFYLPPPDSRIIIGIANKL